MFADIVGYTALMQEDGQLGIETRTKYQEVLRAQHERSVARSSSTTVTAR